MKISGVSVVPLSLPVPGFHSNRQNLSPHKAGSRVLQEALIDWLALNAAAVGTDSMQERVIPGLTGACCCARPLDVVLPVQARRAVS